MHPHVLELFYILEFLVEWKSECVGKGNAVKFIAWHICEDLRYMIFHIAAHAALYLNDNNT